MGNRSFRRLGDSVQATDDLESGDDRGNGFVCAALDDVRARVVDQLENVNELRGDLSEFVPLSLLGPDPKSRVRAR